MLNSQSPVPLYHQLADIILAGIRSGEFPPGTKIPSEHALSDRYGIGRPTVRQAIELLVRKKLLYKKRGSGTFVRARESEVDLFSLAGTTSAFNKKGLSVATTILEKIRRKTVGSGLQNPFAGQRPYFLSRLISVENEPVLIEDVYLHPELFSGIDRIEIEGRSLSQIVEEHYYMQPTGGKQNFMIDYLTGEKAEKLNLSAADPILSVKRFLHFPLAENAVYSELYCRTDRFVFSQIIGGMPDD